MRKLFFNHCLVAVILCFVFILLVLINPVLAYDDNGNITGDGTHTYAWDYNNRLLSSIAGGTTYTYSYDHEGNRIKKVQGANITIYVNKYYEIQPDGKIKKYIFGGDDNIVIIETNGSTKTPYYVHKDHLGGSSVVTDSNGGKYELTNYFTDIDLFLRTTLFFKHPSNSLFSLFVPSLKINFA